MEVVTAASEVFRFPARLDDPPALGSLRQLYPVGFPSS
jgi:hypothetical protein